MRVNSNCLKLLTGLEYANPLIAKLVELKNAKKAGQTPEAIMSLIPKTIQEPPSIEKMNKEQLAEAVKAIKIEPPIEISLDLSAVVSPKASAIDHSKRY